MTTVKLYFDARRLDKQGRGQLRFVVNHKGVRVMLATGIFLKPDTWQNGTVVNLPDSELLNQVISIKKGAVDRVILEQSVLGTFNEKTAKEVADYLSEVLDPDLAVEKKRKEEEQARERNSFIAFYEQFIQTKGNKGTRQLYMDTYNKICAFCRKEGKNNKTLSFSEITRNWLESFELFCLRTERQNTAARHLRDIRAVFNAAIDEEKTSVYPFRRFKIRHEETIDKSFTSEELRALFNSKPYPGGEQESLDIFKLMFCLIGINCVDLAYANKPIKGRLNYVRQKTRKLYSIKLEPEALAIIKKYEGKDYLLDILERIPNYKTYFNRMNKTLRRIGLVRVDGKRSSGKPILPDVCTGSARTSWATIAQEELDIPRDVIAAALGHHTIDVTSTYLRTDWKRKVDEANRKVLDWVFYQRRG